MDKNKKLTLEALIRRKEQSAQAKHKATEEEFYVPSLDATITLREPTASELSDIADMSAEDGAMYIMYNCCVEPNLKAPELQSAYMSEGEKPRNIVKKIFKLGEYMELSEEAVKLAGFNGVKRIKN